MVFDETRITNVRLLVGSTEIYNWKLAWQLEAMRKNPAYQVPAVVDCFPVMLDCIGRISLPRSSLAPVCGRGGHVGEQAGYPSCHGTSRQAPQRFVASSL